MKKATVLFLVLMSIILIVTPLSYASTYRIRSGDTLSAIARRHQTTVGVLTRLNGIRNPNYIRVGQVLRLPDSVPAPPAPTTTSPTAPKPASSGVLTINKNYVRIRTGPNLQSSIITQVNSGTRFTYLETSDKD